MMEKEAKNHLLLFFFLDVVMINVRNQFLTLTYRKKTPSGLLHSVIVLHQ